MVLLTVPAGALDATSFLHLGKVFASVVTGTMVLLGVAAGTHDASLAAHCAVALGGYGLGVLAGARLAGAGRTHARRASQSRDRAATGQWPGWPAAVTRTLLFELTMIAAFSLGWEATGGRPAGAAQLGLVAGAGACMGIQAAAVRRLGRFSTTYLTGTITGVMAGAVTGDRPEGLVRTVGVFAALIAGALAATLIAAAAPAWLPALLLIPLAAVIAVAASRFGRNGNEQAP